MCAILVLHWEYGLSLKSIFNVFCKVGGIWKHAKSAASVTGCYCLRHGAWESGQKTALREKAEGEG